MDIIEAIKKRHKVCKYLDKPLELSLVEKLNARIDEVNKNYGVNIQLVTDNSKCLWGFMKLFVARGVKNFFVLTAPSSPEAETTLGYTGIDVALYAQTLGLNTWWIGETYHQSAVFQPSEGWICTAVIAVGYGATQGVPHKSKSASEVSSYQGDAPQWFVRGVEAALLAPTAMNRQQFFIQGQGREVAITYNNGKWSKTDLGIVKYHFEKAAGRENFTWKM